VKTLTNRIDEIDKKILHLLSANPELSQVDLARHLKVSQPAVSTRIHKLKEAGALAHLFGLEVKKAQLFLAKIDIVTNNTEHVLNALEKCPLYVNGFLTSGRYNLTVILIGENMRSIVSCVDSNLRLDPMIKEMGFDLVVTPVRDFIVPIKPILDKKKITPCGKDCSSCAFYKDNRCLGCPASIHYKGNLL
jgi:DNA-binding Lrp family transcriptional regulator